MTLDYERIRVLCKLALEEDLDKAGDVTTKAFIPPELMMQAYFVTRQECVFCGFPVLVELFKMLDPDLKLVANVEEGKFCLPYTRLASITGSAQSILTGERTALNFIQRLSGIATITRKYVEALNSSSTWLLDTRKTTPGWRNLEKYAVMTGGGHNHRQGLYDQVMIKDNHRELAKLRGKDSIQQAVALARAKYPQLIIEVEADTMDDVCAAIEAKADVIMLDNMDNAAIEKALKLIGGKAKTEASGGITLERLPSMSNLGLTYISSGALTHSAPSIDIGLDM